MSATHEAHFVRSIMERIDYAADKGSHEVIAGQAILLVLDNHLVNEVDLDVAGPWSIAPVVLGIRGMNVELGKPDQIFVGHVLHIEEGFEPFLA